MKAFVNSYVLVLHAFEIHFYCSSRLIRVITHCCSVQYSLSTTVNNYKRTHLDVYII